MGITINGSSAAGNIDLGTNGTITDLAVGGLPDGSVDADSMASIPATKLTGTIADARFPATLPAISGANLTGISSPLSFRNLLINGSMKIDQRGDNSSNTGNAFGGPDRWKWIGGGDATCNTRQGGASDIAGFANQYKVSVGTADTSIGASQYVALQQNLEGFDVQKIEKGFSSAKQLTLSFWLKLTNVTGVFTVQLRDNDNTRHCCKQFTVSDANWNKYTLTFPADTTGKFGDDNGSSLSVNFYWTAGTDYTSGTLASTWASVTTANICPGQTGNFIGSTSNVLELTGVQLELGATATDFEYRTYGDELTRCKRYYIQYGGGGGAATSRILFEGYSGNTQYSITNHLSYTMRAAPSVSRTGSWQDNNVGTCAFDYRDANQLSHRLVVSSAGDAYTHTDADSYLILDSEL